jgi:hypothetical protein
MAIRSLRTDCRRALPLLGVAVLLVAGWFGFSAAAHMMEEGARTPVYSLANLQEGLRRDPAAWLRRTVRVHAVAVQCPGWGVEPDSCFTWHPALEDAHDPWAPALPLTFVPAARGPSWLRSLPVIAGLLPQSRPIAWYIPADYTLQVQATGCAAGDHAACYDAVLEDAAL